MTGLERIEEMTGCLLSYSSPSSRTVEKRKAIGEEYEALKAQLAADLDTLARIREATTDDVRALCDWINTVPCAIDSEYAHRAKALARLLRAIEGAGHERP